MYMVLKENGCEDEKHYEPLTEDIIVSTVGSHYGHRRIPGKKYLCVIENNELLGEKHTFQLPWMELPMTVYGDVILARYIPSEDDEDGCYHSLCEGDLND